MKKVKSKISLFVLMCMVFGNVMLVNAQDADINETDPGKVFPASEVEKLIEEANQKEITIDTKAPTTRASYGSYPTRKGVILVTDDAYKGVFEVGHAAIIYTGTSVVESNPDNGVEIGPNDWNKSKSQAYAVTVKGTTTAQDSTVANWCWNQRSKPYNWNFYRMDYRDKFYCSHLIRAGYLDLYNIDLDTSDFNVGSAMKAIHSMELVNTSQTSLIYRKNKFYNLR